MPFSMEDKRTGLPHQDLDTQMFVPLMVSLLFNDSEFRCLHSWAKRYPVSGPTYLSVVPNQLHYISNCTHEVLGTILGAKLMPFFTKNHLLCL